MAAAASAGGERLAARGKARGAAVERFAGAGVAAGVAAAGRSVAVAERLAASGFGAAEAAAGRSVAAAERIASSGFGAAEVRPPPVSVTHYGILIRSASRQRVVLPSRTPPLDIFGMTWVSSPPVRRIPPVSCRAILSIYAHLFTCISYIHSSPLPSGILTRRLRPRPPSTLPVSHTPPLLICKALAHASVIATSHVRRRIRWIVYR